MKINKIYLVFCVVAVALFFAGRCTKSVPVVVDNKHVIDSLNRRIAQSYQLQLFYKQNAQKSFEKGLNSQKAKVVVRTIYVREIAHNHAMRPAKKDSVIKDMLHVPYSDSSRFTNPVSNGILDLKSENLALKSGALIDSVSIAELTGAYLELDKAYAESGLEGEAKNSLIIEERNTNKKLRKEIRRQKTFKWLAVGGVFVISTLAISK